MPLLRFKHRSTIVATLSLLFRSTIAALVNRTVDDQKGDSVTGALPTYYPDDPGARCSGATCGMPPGFINNSRAFDGTWTKINDSGPEQTVQVRYTGTHVYVYNIVIFSVVPGANALANLTFYIDSELFGSFNPGTVSTPVDSEPPPSLNISFDVLVFSSDNAPIPYGTHDLLMVLGGEGTSAIFDYMIYTTDDDRASAPGSSTVSQSQPASTLPLPSESSSTHLTTSASTSVQTSNVPRGHVVTTSAIVGGSVGGAGAVLSGILILLSIQRLRRRRQLGSRPRSESVLGSEASDAENPATLTPYDITTAEPSREPQKLRVGQYGDSPQPGAPIEPEGRRAANTALHSTVAGVQNARIGELMRQIQLLQAQVDELRNARGTAGSTAGALALSEAEQSLSPVLSALHGEVSALRAELGEQYATGQIADSEVPPSYRE